MQSSHIPWDAVKKIPKGHETWGQGDSFTGKSVKGQAIRELRSPSCEGRWSGSRCGCHLWGQRAGTSAWGVCDQRPVSQGHSYFRRTPSVSAEVLSADQVSSPEAGC